MKNLFTVFLLATLTTRGLAQSNVLTGTVADCSLTPKGTYVGLLLVSPNPRKIGNVFVRPDPMFTTTTVTGTFSFTNVPWGQYQLTFMSRPPVAFNVFVTTNTLGVVNMATLTTNTP